MVAARARGGKVRALSVEPKRVLTARSIVCISFLANTHRNSKSAQMRTNIDIDDDLLDQAMAESGLATKKATVEEALRRLVDEGRRRKALRQLAGIGWEGDLAALRRDDDAP